MSRGMSKVGEFKLASSGGLLCCCGGVEDIIVIRGVRISPRPVQRYDFLSIDEIIFNPGLTRLENGSVKDGFQGHRYLGAERHQRLDPHSYSWGLSELDSQLRHVRLQCKAQGPGHLSMG